ncbi:unnamed protein product [Adineta steineri]|uniref:DUF2817 domain-containing protein n=2 Tax=Adineta steineri TaxID=433720 RepID=A0A813TRA0_9BILA|nr:unnamed protein product [Adineta steineri]CAF0950854.1 unnamed protein product [Adineta steineri]CAF3741758.1 unnamed protein product [Adineta steineri]CAF4180173.1 unnamed protein product [Adineta steineri]
MKVIEQFRLCILTICCLIHITYTSESDNFYYSNTVPEATNKFVVACLNAKGSLEYFDHPSKGVNGEQLQATVCALGNPQARSIIYTISGTHGIEGFAGSMAQISMLRMPPSAFGDNVRVIHLHMINPYGASFISKENEQNADQLKNGAQYYSLNYDNPILQRLIDGIDLPNLSNSTVQQQAFALFAQLYNEYGENAVNTAMKTGQGKRPQGIAYFGPSKSWSSETSEQVVNKYLQNADNILLIDWHTAVGLYGNWTYLPLDNDSTMTFKRWIPDAPTEPNDIVVATGGELPYSYIKTISGAKRMIRVFWEAGTYPVTPNINAMFFLRLHCRFYRNATEPFCQDVIAQTKEYFYPQGADWKRLTYNAVNEYLPRVVSGFVAEVSNGTPVLRFHFFTMTGLLLCLLQFTIQLTR